MASYRFCRTDDIRLLVSAHEACYRPHFPDLPPFTVEQFRSAARELGLWAGSCMIACEGTEPIAVLLAARRDAASLVWRIGVRPGFGRRGHGRHLLTSLRAKQAILGPPRLLVEVPREQGGACAFFEACGFRREVEYTDFVLRGPGPTVPSSDLPIPVTLDDLRASGAIDPQAPRSWCRSPAALLARHERIAGWAVASDERIEAYLLYERPDAGGVRTIVALDCADPERAELWLRLLLGRCRGGDEGPVIIPRVHPAEVSFDLLRSCGFEPEGRTIGGAANPEPA